MPAVNLGLRWLIALSPFLGKTRKRDRLRNGLLLLVRGGLFTALTLYSPHGVIIYFVSYVFFLNMTQFLECFQHTFPTYRVTDKVPKYSFEHVELNTYTIIISRRFRWLDLLFFLNHNYHSAHHRIMTCPWYLLAELDQKIYPPDSLQHVPVIKLIHNYLNPHSRIQRLLHGMGEVKKTGQEAKFEEFFGATGLSFMLLRSSFDCIELPLPQKFSKAKA